MEEIPRTPTIWGLNNTWIILRVEQTLISLLKTCEYVIINIQEVRIESQTLTSNFNKVFQEIADEW